MPRTTITRTVHVPPTRVLNLLLDFERYPAFVPGVRRVRVKPTAATGFGEAVEVEALVKNSKFSGTLRVLVQTDRPAGRILVSHRFGPFKTLSISFFAASTTPYTTDVRCDLDVVATIPAISSIVTNYLKAAANAYADVFSRELIQPAESSLSPT